MSSPVLTAVAWPYANGPRHIGHVSGIGVPSDVFSRYQRMAGKRVLMVSGSDEHGTPILVQAEKEGLTPQQTVDKYHRVISEDLRGLGVTYDLYTRTTTGNHAEVVQQIFLALYRNGYIVPKTTTGAISPSTGRTLPDRYVEGTCPICGYPHARGDQCDNCGNQLDATELINPRSRINGEVPAFVETEHLFLDLPAFTQALGKWLSTKTGWRPNVLNFTRNLVDDMRPRPSPATSTGGPDPARRVARQPLKKLYVWFDAVIGYFSAVSSGPGARATPTRGRPGGTTPTPSTSTSWARTTSPSMPRSGPRCCSATTARATTAASPAPTASSTCPRRSPPASSSR